MRPRWRGSPSAPCAAGRRPARLRIWGISPGLSGGTWMTTRRVAGRSAGSPPTISRRASTPPAEVPITTMSRCGTPPPAGLARTRGGESALTPPPRPGARTHQRPRGGLISQTERVVLGLLRLLAQIPAALDRLAEPSDGVMGLRDRDPGGTHDLVVPARTAQYGGDGVRRFVHRPLDRCSGRHLGVRRGRQLVAGGACVAQFRDELLDREPTRRHGRLVRSEPETYSLPHARRLLRLRLVAFRRRRPGRPGRGFAPSLHSASRRWIISVILVATAGQVQRTMVVGTGGSHGQDCTAQVGPRRPGRRA